MGARSRRYLDLPSLFDVVPEIKPAVVLDITKGKELAKIGRELAVESANRKEKDWSKRCWQLFLFWLRRNVKRGQEFMIEEFRKHVYEYDLIEAPPSERAYSFLSVRAKDVWIEFVRVDFVKNRKAHRARASVWRKK